MKLLYTDEMNSGFNIKFFEKLNQAVVSYLVENEYGLYDDIKEDMELSLLLTDNENIRGLNRDYRHKDYPTDVLSFPMEEDNMLGDIAISLEKTLEQANSADIPFERELAFLYIHGLLHLFGFDHEISSEDETEMFYIQENILKKLVDNNEIC